MRLYHSFGVLGIPSAPLSSWHAENSERKQFFVIGSILTALGIIRNEGRDLASVSFLELFAADAFYSFNALRFGAGSATAVDSNFAGYRSQDVEIATLLDVTTPKRVVADVATLQLEHSFDIVANVGGLYHLRDPLSTLLKSIAWSNRFVILQTVVDVCDAHMEIEVAPNARPWGSSIPLVELEKALQHLPVTVRSREVHELSPRNPQCSQHSTVMLLEKHV